jgi:hypothetical protein
MSWLIWRQHRNQVFAFGVAVAAFAVAVVLTGVHMAHVYDAALRDCAGGADACGFDRLFQGYGAIIDTVHLSIALPVILGSFLGVTVIAREIEHATNTLVWTQSIPRRKWLRSKFGVTILETLVVSAVVTALVTWWSSTPNAINGNRFQGAEFDTQNLVPIAFALFAVALGLAAGCYFRRVLPALATTVVGYTAIRVLVAVYLRPHLGKVTTVTTSAGTPFNVPSGSWTVHDDLVAPTGHAVAVPGGCRDAVDRNSLQTCLGHAGFKQVTKFHPASQYWHFQFVEAALFGVLAIALFVVAYQLVVRRDA